MNPKKELLWGLWLGLGLSDLGSVGFAEPGLIVWRSRRSAYFTYRPQSGSFWGFTFRILSGNPKKELLWGLWVEFYGQSIRHEAV